MLIADPLVRLSMHEDARGFLVAIEAARDLPFPIERVYYILANPGTSRGFHAHKTLQQLMIAVRGSCRILLDSGQDRSSYLLDRPDVGLSVGAMIWREMHDFSDDCVLLVLASSAYDEADYIRDYDAFLRELGQRMP
jgi:dTDP-4-dehydrorhamnose 3,5-epimerase-like enzyme